MNRAFLIAGVSVAVIGMALLLFRQDTRIPLGEKVVEFTYARTQPCNVEYYNYGFSIGPLQDRIKCWSGSKGASQLDFHAKVKAQVKTFPEVSELRIADEIITEAIRRVEFSIVKDVQFAHPIKCRMIVREDDKRVVGWVARAFAQAMMDDLELENKSTSWKATMDKGCLCKRRERELVQLRKQISDKALSVEKQSELRAKMDNAERLLNEAKSLWDASIKAYREKWDASIVFLDEANTAKGVLPLLPESDRQKMMSEVLEHSGFIDVGRDPVQETPTPSSHGFGVIVAVSSLVIIAVGILMRHKLPIRLSSRR